jgi:protease IV
MRAYLAKIGLVAISLVLMIFAFSIGLWIWGAWYDEWSGYNADIGISDGYCNIAVVPVLGDISFEEPTSDGGEDYAVANADDIISMLDIAEYDPYIAGVLVRIDSLGGNPVASEIIANTLKRSSLPTASVIRGYGTSGGYLIATGADVIFASPFSDVGGVGITMSYLEKTQKNLEEGVRFVSLSSALYKDYLNPNKPLTPGERILLERDLKIMHDEFVGQVSENRNMPLADVEQLADGSSMPGELALEKNLIDALGDQESARAWFAEQLELSPEEIEFCE